MERMKWEDNVKQTLEKRAITPSDNSWNVLSARLDAVETRKNRTKFWWMGVAASFIGVVFMMTMFLKDNTTMVQKPVVVDREHKIDAPSIPVEKPIPREQVVQSNDDVEAPIAVDKNNDKSESLAKQPNKEPTRKQNLSVAENETEQLLQPMEVAEQSETLDGRKASEVVAQINELKDQGHSVTDAQIDALLSEAQKEIAFQTGIRDGRTAFNANALLEEVESDLERSFRNKVFEALKTGYETVKTAVAERNN